MSQKPENSEIIDLPVPKELVLEETNDYELVVQAVRSPTNLGGIEPGYAIRHKVTGVVESRHHVFGEAIQMLPVSQENHDRFLGKFRKEQGKLN